MSLIKLFLIFMKTGAILLGGGYVILPILKSEFSEKRNLISNEDLMDFFALSQSLPGIIAVNISMFIGYKLRGKFGALASLLGIIFVPFWSIVLIASVLDKIVNNSTVQSALWGIGLAVTALIILTVREIWQNSKRNTFYYFIFLLSLILLLILKFSPIQVIICMSLLGIIIRFLQRRYRK